VLRRLFTLTPALSLLLCVSGAALWVRSYWADYSAAYAGNYLQRLRRTAFSVEASGGQVDFHHYVADHTAAPRALDYFRRHMPAAGFLHATEDRSRFTALGSV
jgi:hypothetical protein